MTYTKIISEFINSISSVFIERFFDPDLTLSVVFGRLSRSSSAMFSRPFEKRACHLYTRPRLHDIPAFMNVSVAAQ